MREQYYKFRELLVRCHVAFVHSNLQTRLGSDLVRSNMFELI